MDSGNFQQLYFTSLGIDLYLGNLRSEHVSPKGLAVTCLFIEIGCHRIERSTTEDRAAFDVLGFVGNYADSDSPLGKTDDIDAALLRRQSSRSDSQLFGRDFEENLFCLSGGLLHGVSHDISGTAGAGSEVKRCQFRIRRDDTHVLELDTQFLGRDLRQRGH